MFPIIGLVILFGSIVGGYLLEHGNLHVLIQPAEFVILGGAAIGSMVVICPPNLLIKIIKGVIGIFGGSKFNKAAYITLFTLLYNVFSKIKKEGLLAVEKDIEDPEKSALFKQYPSIVKDHHAINFICDNLRIFVVGVKPMEMEEMITVEMDTHHQEVNLPSAMLSNVSDSLPGFGIVAAVLGVVITMGKMSESPEVIGHSIAAALVGTFLGILLCYGVLSPIAKNMENSAREQSLYFEAIKVSILAFAKDLPPQMAVEAGRRALFSEVKPSFKELEEALRKKK